MALEKPEKVLRGLAQRAENRRCFDCDSIGCAYVVPSVGVFVCTECSGAHMKVGHRVKSISMGKFTPEEVADLESGGNQVASRIWLAKWKPEGDNRKPLDKNPRKIEAWVTTVFLDKKYYSSSGPAPVQVQAPHHSPASSDSSSIPVRPLTDVLGSGSASLRLQVSSSPSGASGAAAAAAPHPAAPAATSQGGRPAASASAAAPAAGAAGPKAPSFMDDLFAAPPPAAAPASAAAAAPAPATQLHPPHQPPVAQHPPTAAPFDPFATVPLAAAPTPHAALLPSHTAPATAPPTHAHLQQHPQQQQQQQQHAPWPAAHPPQPHAAPTHVQHQQQQGHPAPAPATAAAPTDAFGESAWPAPPAGTPAAAASFPAAPAAAPASPAAAGGGFNDDADWGTFSSGPTPAAPAAAAPAPSTAPAPAHAHAHAPPASAAPSHGGAPAAAPAPTPAPAPAPPPPAPRSELPSDLFTDMAPPLMAMPHLTAAPGITTYGAPPGMGALQPGFASVPPHPHAGFTGVPQAPGAYLAAAGGVPPSHVAPAMPPGIPPGLPPHPGMGMLLAAGGVQGAAAYGSYGAPVPAVAAAGMYGGMGGVGQQPGGVVAADGGAGVFGFGALSTALPVAPVAAAPGPVVSSGNPFA